MKIAEKFFLTGAATVLSLGMTTAFAASSTTMKVAGKVTVGSCSTDGSSLTVDLGTIQNNPALNQVYPDQKELTLLLTCDAPTAIAIKVQDNSPTDKPTTSLGFINGLNSFFATPDSFYGLQDKATGKKIGAYLVGFDGIRVDDGAGVIGGYNEVALSTDGKNWSTANRNAGFSFTGSVRPYVTPVTLSGGVPSAIPGTTFEIPITIFSTILKDRLPASLENLAVDGSATFEVIYL